MDPDLFFVLGVALAVLSVPAILSAFLDGRAPRVAAYVVLIGGLMIGYAISQKPTSYSWEKLPDVVTRVMARYLN